MPVKDIMRERARADWDDLRPLNPQIHPYRLVYVTHNSSTPRYRHMSSHPREAPLEGNDTWTHLSAVHNMRALGRWSSPDPIIAWRLEQNIAPAGAPPCYRELGIAGQTALLPERKEAI